MKIFIQLSIIFLMINPMFIVCSKKSSTAQVNKSKSNKSKLDASQEEIIRYENGITTTLIKDSQTGKVISSKTELNDGTIVHQVMNKNTGKKESGTVIRPDGLKIGQTFDGSGTLIEQHIINTGLDVSDQRPVIKAPTKSEPTSLHLTSSVASKSKSVSTMAKDSTTPVIQNAKAEKAGESTTQLQGRDQQTGKKTSVRADAIEGLGLLEEAPTKSESTSSQPTSVASKPKSVSTIVVGGKEKTWESNSFDTKANSEVADVTSLDKVNIKDSTSQQSNKEGNKSLQAKPQVTQSFVSGIEWSKLSPTKTISKTTSKAISSAVATTSNFLKDVSLTFKQKIGGKELSPSEQSSAVRSQREQILKIDKQINTITSRITEKQSQLAQAEKALQIEQEKPASKDVWIAKHKKDIAELRQTIEKQQQQQKSLQAQQKKLMADKFTHRGDLIVKSAAPVEAGIVSPIHSQVAGA